MLITTNQNRSIPLALGSFVAFLIFGGIIFAPSALGATSASGSTRVEMEVATSIAMKIVSPNDVNPDCLAESDATYGVANRYASSTGDNSGRVVDTFDGREGAPDEVNENTSCAKLSVAPNTFDSTYSDVTVFTNSPSGYALTVQSTENTSPNLVNTLDNTHSIPAEVLAESDGAVSGGQNKWSYRTNNGIVTDWTAMTTSPASIKVYDNYTEGGDTTRVIYGISTGTNPAGTYTTELTYTATMFDGTNPYVGNIEVPEATNLTISPRTLSIPLKSTKSLTVTPAEGYYLSEVICPTGYTCSGYTTDKFDETSAAAQAITIKNESNTSSTVANLGLSVQKIDWVISISNLNTVSNVSSVDIPAGGSATVIVTADSGYYLNEVSCPEGFTCSGYYADRGTTQSITISDNGASSNGSLSLVGVSSPDCSSSTPTHDSCLYGSSKVLAIKLEDDKYWTAKNQGSMVWDDFMNLYSCPNGMNRPSLNTFQTLRSKYGTTDGALHHLVPDWSYALWSTTALSDSAYYFSVRDQGTDINGSYKVNHLLVVCYGE